MIFSIMRAAAISLRRDKGSLALAFALPIGFFTIFATIFGGHRSETPRVSVIVADEDHSSASQRLVAGMQRESSLKVLVRPEAKDKVEAPLYTASAAQAAVQQGEASVALVIPQGFGANPMGFDQSGVKLQLLRDPSDMVAPQVVAGMLQKVAMTSLSDLMAEKGSKYWEKQLGGYSPEQRKRMEDGLAEMRRRQSEGENSKTPSADGGLIAVEPRDVVGAQKANPMVSFYAAACGVMFLLFTASGVAGALLDEAESGTLDRVLSSRVTMTTLLAGKLVYSSLLAFAQLTVMFVWGWAVFKLDLWTHIPGFIVMGLVTAFAVGAFGLLLASICKTRAQLGQLSTLVILTMSSIGGSMFPRFLMPPAVQKAGLLTLNAWAIDGFTKVFWRDEPVAALWPQVLVLVLAGAVLFALARHLAHRWECA